MGFGKAVGVSIGKVFLEGWEPQMSLEGTGVLLCPISLGAGAKRGRFVPTSPVLALGHCLRNWTACLILDLVTPCNVKSFL